MMIDIGANAKEQLRNLVELFQANIVQYKSVGYDEANARIDFIDKFFELFGWDVRNVAGYSEQYRDVVREDKVVIDNRPKAPDYAFRIGKERKFFVEAKKPSVNIHDDIVPAYQVRRYGYTAKLPLCILTDFEEFAVYDTRIKPHHTDKASVARIFYCKYDEYLDKFDFLTDTFSKDAVLRGSFDKYVQSTKNKKGTSEVDTELLALVEDWRLTLAKNIAKQNPTLDSFNLNTAVQRIVDRILFLRIAEDRRIEQYEGLWNIAKKPGIYAGLQHLFVAADEKYNAGLFRQEDWLAKITVDDKVLAPIIKGLYYPESPYEFSVLPIEILGSIYERFLGKTIVLSPSHVAKVEEKPEVRKAGGVYYTPQYIVDYIVAETVGRKLKPENTNKAKSLPTVSVLDPACGSGSFLVGAYTFLLDEHLSFYLEEANLKKSLKTGLIYEFGTKTYRLSIEEKQRILLGSIFGVDIDPIAVEVTKLSLYLKLLENENDESAKLLFKYSDLKMLPDLDSNIRCGNSLIGSDFYQNKDMPIFGDEAIRRINAFDWHKEFPAVFSPVSEKQAEAGFDCVIGNPPYVQLSMEGYYNEEISQYIQSHYSSSMGRTNTFGLFIERIFRKLLATDGMFGYIVPNTILTQEYYQALRLLLLENSIETITLYDYPVFSQAVVETIVLTASNTKPRKNHKTKVVHCNNRDQMIRSQKINQSIYQSTHRNSFLTEINQDFLRLKQKLDEGGIRLGDIVNINQAIALKHGRALSLFRSRKKGNYKPVIDGRHIGRYSLIWGGDYLAYDRDNIHSCKRTDIFECNEKIFFRRVGDQLLATLDSNRFYALNTLVVITRKTENISIKFILALFNSKLFNFYYQKFLKSTKKIFSEIQAHQVAQIPVPSIDLSDKKLKAKHDRLVSLVNQMLSAQERLRLAVSDSDTRTCRQRVEALDTQIDAIVYELYNLTDEEIKIVEG